MNVTIDKQDNITIVAMEGKLDGVTSQDAYDQILPTVTDNCRLVFDMEYCVYVSSAGLRIILMLGKQIKRVGGLGVMANLSEEVLEVMEMTGFDHIFKNYETLAAAMEALK